MPLHYKRGSLWGFNWYRVKAAWAHHNGAWQPIKKIFINSGGTWKQVEPTTGVAAFTQPEVNHQFSVPPFVRTIIFSGAGGGGGAGNIVDGGRNDDRGGAGAGGGGQRAINFPISVIPGEIITIRVGGGGGNAGSSRDSGNTGGNGGNTTLTCSSGTYTLIGGAGGQGGVGHDNNMFEGGRTSTANSMPISVVWGETGSFQGARGGAGVLYNTSTGVVSLAWDGQAGYAAGGGSYNYGFDATQYGGGGAGGYFGYIRQDNGNHPGWGGKGKSGLVVIRW